MSSHELPLEVLGKVPPGSSDVQGYLWFNRDVADAARQSADPDFGLHHLQANAIAENRDRLNSESLPMISAARSEKMEWLFKRSPGSATGLEPITEPVCGYPLTTMKVKGDPRLPVPYERVSHHAYDSEIEAWFDGRKSDLFLDVGAGLRTSYRDNVVFTEIAFLPTTDILAFGDHLPFDDDTFDGIACLAVLEHVPDPFAVAREMMRVVRPGCRVVVDWPFLQPVHGYPHHYFNATEEGAREAFERIDQVASVESTVPPWLHPVFTLRWFLDEWRARLPEDVRDAFGRISVDEILGQNETELSRQPWARALPQELLSTISAGTRISVTKRD
jgi:hypothetical protein